MKPINDNCCSPATPVTETRHPITRHSHPRDIREALRNGDLSAAEHREVALYFTLRAHEAHSGSEAGEALAFAQVHATLALGDTLPN